MVPMPLFNEDGILEITLATAAEMDVGTGVFAMSGGVSLEVLVNRRQAPGDLPHAISELNEFDVPYSSVGRQAFDLPALGSYTGILLRSYSSASARGDISQTNGHIALELANTTIRRARFSHLFVENELSKTSLAGKFLGTVFFDFLTDGLGDVLELNSVIDANPSATQGSRFRILQDVDGAANKRIRYLTHRIYGDLSALKVSAR